MTAMTQDRSAIMREYLTAITAADKEYKTSISNAISNAQRILDSKKKEASETMQAKLNALAQSTTQPQYTIPTQTQVQNFEAINTKWNVVPTGDGKWVASKKPVLFGH